jgi:ribosomal protein S18 acetylase RimI-like enzyme
VSDIRPLTGIGWEALATAFNAAFADYVLPMKIDAVGLEAMQRRRGYAAELSFGAFEEDRLAGFVLTCIEGDRAYNSGTGVVREHRRGGLARRLLDEVIAHVDASRYVLEVIETNASARALYQSAGFVEARDLQSWTFAAPDHGPPLPTMDLAALDALVGDADIEPSWQNSLASIRRATERHVVLGDEDGAAVVFPDSADMPFMIVGRGARRRGHGRRLLVGATATARRPIRIVNVDDRSADIARFLEAAGATKLVRQVEMIRDLA